jgi:hypothetical protein
MYGMETIKVQSIFHLFLIFVFSMIFIWIGITYVSQNIQYSSAQRFFNAVVREIEDSYFSKETMEQCIQNAKDNGYLLTIKEYSSKEHRDAKIRLDFSYTYPIIQKVQPYSIEGYAR